jgi:hypothetical protein
VRWCVVIVLLASCERPSVHDRECDVVRELARQPRKYENFIFERLKTITWQDPELRALVAYATAANDPDMRDNPPYLWDGTATRRLHDICAIR